MFAFVSIDLGWRDLAGGAKWGTGEREKPGLPGGGTRERLSFRDPEGRYGRRRPGKRCDTCSGPVSPWPPASVSVCPSKHGMKDRKDETVQREALGPNVATAVCRSLPLGPGGGGGSHQKDPKCQLAVTSGREEPEVLLCVSPPPTLPFVPMDSGCLLLFP